MKVSQMQVKQCFMGGVSTILRPEKIEAGLVTENGDIKRAPKPLSVPFSLGRIHLQWNWSCQTSILSCLSKPHLTVIPQSPLAVGFSV